MSRSNSQKIYKIALVAMFTALTAVGAFIRIPLPVIPFTLQIFFTTMAGLLLGPKLGALAVGTYVLLGLCGVPVFTGGGGFTYIFSSSFGYIIGFVGGAFLTGLVSAPARRKDPSRKKPGFFRLLAAGFAGLGVIYALGLVHCYVIYAFYLKTPMKLGTLLLNGFVMTIPADILKMILAAFCAQRLIPIVCKREE